MRPAERLFQLLQLIRGRRLSTAQWLSERMEVSVRTVYRDVAALQQQGVPIEGEAGVGYRLAPNYHLPPLMFSPDEAQALVAAVRVASPRLDPALARQAEQALSKILSVLPPASRALADRLALHAPGSPLDAQTLRHLGQIREAIEARCKLSIDYRDVQQRPSLRRVRPLACLFWNEVWTVAAWCEMREDFRQFRLDRLQQVNTLDETFRDEPGKTLADLRRRVGAPPG